MSVDARHDAYINPTYHKCTPNPPTQHTQELMDARKELNRRLKALSDNPSEAEVAANSTCGVCKKDWGKRGPTCGLCRLEGLVTGYRHKLNYYRKQGNAQREGMTARSGADAGTEVLQLRPGGERLEVWKGHVALESFKEPCEAHRLLYRVLVGWLRQQASRRRDDPAWQAAAEEAQCEMRIQEALEKELRLGWRFWNSHYVRVFCVLWFGFGRSRGGSAYTCRH